MDKLTLGFVPPEEARIQPHTLVWKRGAEPWRELHFEDRLFRTGSPPPPMKPLSLTSLAAFSENPQA